jgi:hypothetical protein
MKRRETTHTLIKKVLGEDYRRFDVAGYEISEEVGGAGCTARVTLRPPGGRALTIEGTGVGAIDAVYAGLVAHFAREFKSLETVQFTGFSVASQMDTSRNGQGTDAEASVTLTVLNSEGRRFEFESADRSVLAASIDAVVQIAEYFVNSERAFINLYRALVDARARGRADLIETFTAQLAEVVNTTSYTEVIADIRKGLGLS